ncbi:hypothetical protein ACFLTH_15320 [Bacteroidota bacterium]
MTLKQLRDKIILDAHIEGNPKYPIDRLTKMVNDAQKYIQMELVGLGIKKWLTRQVITAGLTAGAFNSSTNNVDIVTIGSTYFPSLLESAKPISFIEVTDATTYGVAFPVDEDEFTEALGNSFLAPTLKKPIFTRIGASVYIAPITVTVATAYYNKVITDLSADDGVSEIPVEYEDLIVKRVVDEIKGDKVPLTIDINEIYKTQMSQNASKDAIRKDDRVVLQ